MFEQKVPALKFKRYQCVRSTNVGLAETHLAVSNDEDKAQHVEAL